MAKLYGAKERNKKYGWLKPLFVTGFQPQSF
jgi:hypothetical protein